MDGIYLWSIAICDDDPKFCLDLADMLTKISGERAEISIFYSGITLLEAYDRQKEDLFDLIFIDVEMPGLNGISTTNEIKQIDQGVIVIVLTNYQQYALPAFSARAFHYLLKPISWDKVAKVYREAVDELALDKMDTLVVSWRQEIRHIRFTKIYYIESYADLLEIHTVSEKIKVYCSLKKMAELLKEQSFARVHKSYIVNLNKIDYIDKSRYIAVLFDGSQIPLSRRTRSIQTLFAKMVELAEAKVMGSKNRRKT